MDGWIMAKKESKEKKSLSADEDFISLARDRFAIVQSAEDHIRKAALEDLHFVYNVGAGQWPEDIRKQREEDKRPCLTSNKLRKFVAQVANRERENRISINVVPVDDKSDINTAKVIEGIIRNIEYQSSADETYARAGENAITGGFGYWRILTNYTEDSFEQEITIEAIDNPFTVYMDPKERFCFIREAMTEKEFKVQYPDAQPEDFELASRGEEWEMWYEPEKVYIAEYFVKEPETKTLAQVKNPTTNEIDIVELKGKATKESLEQNGYEVLQTREVKGHKIMWYKITGSQILEKEEMPGKYIPVVQVLGDRINVAGKEYKRGLIRDGKDPQRMYNYWLTSMTEKVALAPKAPFLVTPQEISGHETMWKEANIKNQPYLLYNAQGQRIPQRQRPAEIDPGSMGLLNIANADIKDVLGMYEPTLGQQSNERSGIALRTRQNKADLGTFLFPDNLRRALIKTGKILIDLIPVIYDTERMVRVLGYEGEEKIVPINMEYTDNETGQVMIHDLSVGKFDVQADTRVYSSRRQETADLMIQAMQYAPALAPIFADLVFKYMDSPGAQEIEQRIKQYMAQQQQANQQTPPGKAGGATQTS